MASSRGFLPSMPLLILRFGVAVKGAVVSGGLVPAAGVPLEDFRDWESRGSTECARLS